MLFNIQNDINLLLIRTLKCALDYIPVDEESECVIPVSESISNTISISPNNSNKDLDSLFEYISTLFKITNKQGLENSRHKRKRDY